MSEDYEKQHPVVTALVFVLLGVAAYVFAVVFLSVG